VSKNLLAELTGLSGLKGFYYRRRGRKGKDRGKKEEREKKREGYSTHPFSLSLDLLTVTCKLQLSDNYW